MEQDPWEWEQGPVARLDIAPAQNAPGYANAAPGREFGMGFGRGGGGMEEPVCDGPAGVGACRICRAVLEADPEEEKKVLKP